MSIRIKAIYQLQKILGAREATDIINLSKQQESLEAKWQRKMKEEIQKITTELMKNAKTTGKLKFSEVDFSEIVMAHSFEVLKSGINSAQKRPQVRAERLAGPPKSQIPRSMKALRIMWDKWRTIGKMPPRQKSIAEKLKKAYLKKVQSVWVKYGDEFRSGITESATRAVEKIQEGADVIYSRAKMIVETETTYYYNRARRDIYDESPDVTHYLFVAIRDHATTKWCKTRNGLVYAKGDPLLETETPPIHWNCRSEILPLTAHNPNHRKLIEDPSRKRRNHKCFPLPKGWTGR